MDTEIQRLTLVLDGGSDTDDEELAALTAHLRRHLLELDVEAVESIRSDKIPPGAKPVDAASIGALVVTASTRALRAVVGLLQAWLHHRPVRSAKVTIGADSIELINASEADQERLVQAFLERHASG